MHRKFLVNLPYFIQKSSSSLPEWKKIKQEVNVSPFVRFNLKGNHFLLKADGPALVREDQIILRFSVNTVIEIQPIAPEFGNVHLPHSGTQILSLHNSGNVPLSITRAVFENQVFWLSTPSILPLQLLPGAKASMQIHFRPAKLGPHRSTLVLWSNELQHPALNLLGYGAESQVVISELLIQRVLVFFNNVNNPQEIINRIMDDPSFLRAGGATYGVNFQQARNILNYRKRLPNKYFTSLEQLDAIPGIGPDTLHDILYSFVESD